MSITPSLHKDLAHSWELIEKNDGCGLGMLDEAGMEGCIKIPRRIRTQQSRKISQSANLSDTLNRMWMDSDPKINAEGMKSLPYSTRDCSKRRMQQEVQAEDLLFESFISK